MTHNRITEVTRRALFDELRMSNFRWSGRLPEASFLARVCDLTQLPSHDSRHRTMAEDVSAHRDHWDDWGGPEWVYDDSRLHLMWCDDEFLLKFLCETLHPVVRTDETEVKSYAAIINKHIGRDGLELYPASYVSGRPIYAAREQNQVHVSGIADAHGVAVALQSSHVMAQITRMQTVENDPALAIGTAKEFAESICKSVLTDRKVAFTGSENLPQLVRLTMKALDLIQESESRDAIRQVLSSLSSLVHGLAELRGQVGSGHGHHPTTPAPLPILARLAVGAATTLGVFLYEAHDGSMSK